MKIAVFTNDNHLWLLQGFTYLFNTFWSKNQKVDIVGFNPPKFKLPSNFNFVSLSRRNYPKNKWTNGLIKYLVSIHSDLSLIMLEDFWLRSSVNVELVQSLWNYMQTPEATKVLRIDLTADRLAKKHKPYFGLEGLGLISTPPKSKYQMSFQAAIWNVDMLLKVLHINETPWEAEVNGTTRLSNRPDILVLGTTQWPVRYRPVYRTHKNELDLSSIPKKHRNIIKSKGWTHGHNS